MILAVVGLQRERRIVAGAETETVVGGGDHKRLDAVLEAHIGKARGVVSIGIAGGLAPQLRAGDWVLADTVLADGQAIPTDTPWTGRLAARLPEATRGLLVGVDAIIAEAAEKTVLRQTTGALALDMESHIVARVARRHRMPFVAARVVSDPAHRALPPAARGAMKPDGRIDLAAVLRSLLAQPSQLPALVATGWEAERGFRSLLRGHRRLGPGLCGPDLGELALDVT
jgi:hopanoid-associated phosphorylase